MSNKHNRGRNRIVTPKTNPMRTRNTTATNVATVGDLLDFLSKLPANTYAKSRYVLHWEVEADYDGGHALWMTQMEYLNDDSAMTPVQAMLSAMSSTPRDLSIIGCSWDGSNPCDVSVEVIGKFVHIFVDGE